MRGTAYAALIIALLITQGWRFASEFLRADYRGQGFISAYQIMILFAIGYTLLVVPFIKEPDSGLPNLLIGIKSLWNPGLIIFLVVLWIVAFVYAGKSSVTCSSINIQIIEKNI